MKKKFLLKNFTRLVFVIICLELIVRFLGIANGPLRLANKELGYIPQANQEGRFLYNHWTFNDLHMNSRNNFSYIGNEILILGDSVVWGGNRLDQKERIGWLINNLSGEKNTFVVAEQSIEKCRNFCSQEVRGQNAESRRIRCWWLSTRQLTSETITQSCYR